MRRWWLTGRQYAASIPHEEDLLALDCICFKGLDHQIDIALGLTLFSVKDTIVYINILCANEEYTPFFCQYSEMN